VGQVWFDLLLAPLEKGDLFMSRKRTKKFVTIDRDLYEAALKVKIGGRARAFLFAFLLQTNGFEKDFDKKSWKRYTNLTAMRKEHLSYIKSVLIKNRCMYEKDGILYLQKDLSKWKGLPNSVTLKKVIELDNVSYLKRQPEVTESGKHILTPHLNNHLKQDVVSQQKRKEGEVPEGFKDLMKDIANMPGYKKENSHLIKKRQK